MQRIRVIWVGKTAKGFPEQGVDHYLKRIGGLAQIECAEVRAASHSGRDPAQALKTESAALLRRIGKQDRVILLDERGIELTSLQLAQWLAERRPAAFVIGGAYGVDEAVQARADDRLALSRLTLPHQLVRIVLLEQIYRALTIAQGQAYHHG